MPTESGFDLAKRVREDSFGYAHMAIIFISALAESKAQIYGAHCGADDYITKPINYGVLREKIALHLGKSNSLAARLAKMMVSTPAPAAAFVERRLKPAVQRTFGRRSTD